MIKSNLISITRSIVAVFLLAVPTCLVAQNYQPKSYYTFEGSSPMKDSMGNFNLDPNYYQSSYQILTNTSGGVGKYMKLDSSSTIIRGGVLAIDSAITFEFIFKPGMNFGTTVFAKRMDGALELRMTYPAINFMTEVKAANGSPIYDDFEIDLNGIGRASYSYYVDDNWHHIVFKYNAKAGIKEVWVDGQLPAGFSKTIAGGSFSQSGNRDYMLNSQSDYYKLQGAIDEIAVYHNSLGGNSIYAHYLNFMAGKHYSFANPTVVAPSPSPVTAGININDFAPGHPSPSLTPIEQLKNFPTPRYKPGHTLFPNNPFVGYYYLSGYQTYETVYSKAVANSVTLQTDFAKNFNYTIMAAENT
ncbi:MAG: LamG-like jellyroll fold domain-containing protein, partial [Bacteroidota bacterium]